MVERSADLGKLRRSCDVGGSLCSEKRKEWTTNWQCDEEVQNVEEKLWKNEELRIAEEAVPRPKECLLEEVSRLFKAKTGVGCDGFHPEVPLGLDKGTERRNRGVPREGGAEWKVAATSMHDDVLLDSEECDE